MYQFAANNGEKVVIFSLPHPKTLQEVEVQEGVIETTMALAEDFDPMERAQEFAAARGWTDLAQLENPPEESEFSDAWDISGNAITVDVEKAKAIQVNNLRTARDKWLDLLDMYGLTNLPEKRGEINALKQALRNMPENSGMDGAATLEEVKTAIPQAFTDVIAWFSTNLPWVLDK